ncbi:uncharacterized protein Dwil_GK21858, partial [Drosophila willistoni]
MFETHLTVLFHCLILAFISAARKEKYIVCPPKVGCIRGTTMSGYQKGPFEAFMGIPYAEPPVGALRFRNPIIKARWFNTYDATQFKPDCIQKNRLVPHPTIFGDEDCLYLNIYRPKVRLRRLPVMIYIHGGGFFSGSAGPLITGPEYIMDTESVILVTMSYRLGALGFMSTGDYNMPGNFGLKDQNLVFKWVRRNIESFDGDNKKVTIFGQSAGAVATHMHLINPYSKNLFHRVISMSGTANAPFAITKNPLEQARETAKLCVIQNADTLSTAKLAEALRNVNIVTLINAGDGLKHWDVDPSSVYRPVVEPPSIDAIIPADPEKMMKSIYFQKRPWLLGTVPQEGAVRAINIIENPILRQKFNERFQYLYQELLEWPNRFTPRQAKDKTEIIVDEYLDDYFLMFTAHLIVLYLCLYFAFISAAGNESLIVCPPKVGCLRGTTMNGYQKGPFEAFMGIPYAEPPLGALRFQSPKIKARWFNTYDATKFKSDCIQKNYLSPNPMLFGNENCLYLNIYRPKVRLGLLPVMIYIQGWGFFSGSANPKVIGPEYIMDTQSVILVTMSYRLGALGFMSTGDYNMPGNFGLKDQSLVFKWVRHNIESFDGDNKKVTIFGHDAGAVATHMHLINPYSKNLFHRVISMSGTANVPFAITKDPLAQARKTANLCEIPNADTLSTAKLTEALRNVNAKTLIDAGGQLPSIYRPVVEPPSIDAIIPAAPEILMKSIYFQKRPWLLGTV